MSKLKMIKAIDPYTFQPKLGIVDDGKPLFEFNVELANKEANKDLINSIISKVKSLVDDNRSDEVDEFFKKALSKPMTINEYQNKAIETAIYGEGSKIIYPTLGLTGEAGEVADKVKKVLRDNDGVFTDEKKLELAKELSDTCWYIAALARDLGYTMEEICIINLEKLKSRQERGVIGGSGDNR